MAWHEPTPEALTMRKDERGVHVDYWPPYILVENCALEHADPTVLEWNGSGRMRITVCEGTAEYLLGDIDPRWLARPGRLVALIER